MTAMERALEVFCRCRCLCRRIMLERWGEKLPARSNVTDEEGDAMGSEGSIRFSCVCVGFTQAFSNKNGITSLFSRDRNDWLSHLMHSVLRTEAES